MNTRSFLLLFLFVTPVALADDPFVRGDSNADGAVNLPDAATTFRYLFVRDTPLSCLDAADANDDGHLDVSDPISLLVGLFLDGSEPPKPRETFGLDPTADRLSCLEYEPWEHYLAELAVRLEGECATAEITIPFCDLDTENRILFLREEFLSFHEDGDPHEIRVTRDGDQSFIFEGTADALNAIHLQFDRDVALSDIDIEMIADPVNEDTYRITFSEDVSLLRGGDGGGAHSNACTAVPDSGRYFNFHSSCHEHDDCYARCGGRRTCDWRFYRDMRSSCRSRYARWYQMFPRSRCYRYSNYYYFGVRVLGWLFYSC